MIKPMTLLMFLVFVAQPALAGSIDVEYKSFYSHVRKLQQEDTQDLQFAFGFMNIDTQQLCRISEAKIVTQKQTIALDITKEYRFTVPSERALKLAEALVLVDVEEAANKCDMSVQLETKPLWLKQTYSNDDLKHIYDQYTAFFNEMGSFLSFLMPSVQGLMVYFEDPELSASLKGGIAIQKGLLILNDETLANLDELTLPAVPQRITALAKR